MRKVVIVGAGQSGGCAAAAIKAADPSSLVTLVGLESHPPYERPPLSKNLLVGEISPEMTYIRPLSWYAENGIDLRLATTVGAIDPVRKRVLTLGGDALSYDQLLLTTGARARRMSMETASQNVFYLRNIEDSLALRERLTAGYRLALIGGGFIGLEVAAAARKLGCFVTVIETGSTVLSRVAPRAIGDFVADVHRGNGVAFEFGAGVATLSETTCVEIHLADGRVIAADGVAVGIGAKPNTELAQHAGISVDDGVVVDEFGRTSDPAIFAAGDVTKHYNPILKRYLRLETWQNAQNQAIAVARVITGSNEPFREVPWAWSDQYDLNIQIAGAPLHWDALVYRGDVDSRRFIAFQLLKGAIVGAVAVNASRDMRAARKMIESGFCADTESLSNIDIPLS